MPSNLSIEKGFLFFSFSFFFGGTGGRSRHLFSFFFFFLGVRVGDRGTCSPYGHPDRTRTITRGGEGA